MSSIFGNSVMWAGMIDSLAWFWKYDPWKATFCNGKKKASSTAYDWGRGVQSSVCGNGSVVTSFLTSKPIMVLFGSLEYAKSLIFIF